MNNSNHSPYRRTHRKRISALRLSSDSNVPTLPAYTSPPWQTPVALPAEEDLSDKPPEYSDSAEEADADTDSDDDLSANRRIYSATSNSYVPPTPPLTFSPPPPRRQRRSQASGSRSSHRPQPSSPTDPYLDSLLARSVHALEMSNALLQSSMSTQSSLSTVLASDNMVDTSLDAHARNLSSRIRLNDNMQDSWMNNLDEISKDVEGLFANEAESSNTAISRSLPSSGSIHRSHLRRPSVEFRRSGVNSTSDSSLNYTNHARNDLVAPPPRALTIYVDSTEDPSAITLPSTLGLRSYTLSSTSLPADLTCSPPSDPTPSSSRAADILVTLTKPPARPKARRSSASSTSTATTITSTIFKSRRASKSPPPLHIQRPPSKSPSPQIRSRSLTRNDSPVRYKHSNSSAIIEPIEELSASSGETSSSDSLHVDRTLESLRIILEKSPPSRSPSTSRKPPLPRPSLLTPPTVEPVASTSTATASISKLFTKGRHSSSTRPPSPPRHSSLKVRSTPATPTMHTPSPSMSGSLLIVPDALNGAGSSRLSSGQSTPKRISFAQLPEFTTGTSSRPSTRGRKSKSRSKSSLPTSRKGRDDKEDGEDPGASGGWFSSWLLGAGAASTKGGGGMGGLSGPSASVLAEERFGRSVGSLGSWGARPGLGGLEDWAV